VVDNGREAMEGAGPAQAVHPALDRGSRQRDPAPDVAERPAPVLYQQCKDLLIGRVDTSNCCANTQRCAIDSHQAPIYLSDMAQHAPPASVLFDEAHGEAWTIRPGVAGAMQPSHPEDSSYAIAAKALRSRGFRVAAHVHGPLTGTTLDGVAVL